MEFATPRFASHGVSYKTRGELTSKHLRRPLYPLVHVLARMPRARMLVSPRDVERRMRCIAAFHARLRSILSSVDHYGYRKKCITLFLREFNYIVKSGMIFLTSRVAHQANIKIFSISLLKKSNFILFSRNQIKFFL